MRQHGPRPEWPLDTFSADVLRASLAAAGYRCLTRSLGWRECLLSRGDERWVGRGETEDEALADALRQMCPSHWSRTQLAEHLTARVPLTTNAPMAPPDAQRAKSKAPALTLAASSLPPLSAGKTQREPPGARPVVPSEHALSKPAAVKPPAPQPPPPAESPTPARAPGPPRSPPQSPSQRPVDLNQRKPSSSHASADPEADPSRTSPTAPGAPGRSGATSRATAHEAPASPGQAHPRSDPPRTASGPDSREAPTREAHPEFDPHRAPPAPDDDLARLADRLEASVPSLAMWPAELQRLALLAVLCRARALARPARTKTDTDPALKRLAARIQSLHHDLAPGHLRALPVNATLQEVRADLGLTHGDKFRDWDEAASQAELFADTARDALDATDRDEDGWRDGPSCEPPPADASARLDALIRALEQFAGPLGKPSPASTQTALQQRGADHVAHLTRWLLELRWLRPHLGAHDRFRWAQALGRLRWALTCLPRDLRHPLEPLFDPLHRPERPYPQELGEDPSGRTHKKARKLLLKRRPGPHAEPAEVASWLAEAFALGDDLGLGPLAAELTDLTDQIAALAEDRPSPDRAFQRRVKRLHWALSERTRAAKSTASDPSPLDLGRLHFDHLLHRVRERVAGLPALFISNRSDPALKASLEQHLGLTLDWVETEPRRLQAKEDAIRQGRYALVLSATGFQDHNVDRMMVPEARAIGIPYVRVDRGRLGACVRALARDLGLED